MASLGALKRGMATTLFLVWLLLFILIGAIAILLLRGAGLYGWVIVIFLTFIFIFLQWAIGPSIVAWSTRLKYIKKGENPFLETMVAELCQKSNVPMPKLAIVEDQTPNAFVFGRTLNSSTLAVHTGLLTRLNSDEIRAVIGHEVGHLKHRDVIIMTIAGAIPLLAYMIAYMFFFGGRGAKKEAGLALLALAALAFAIYFITFLLVKRLSRLREYYADSYSAFVTMNPHGLSSALTKITYGLSLSKKETSGARSFYIGDPISAKREISSIMKKRHQYDLDGDGVLDDYELEKAMEAEAKSRWSSWNEMSSTHPPTFKRILQLKQIEEEIKASGEMGGNIYKHI
ncbi:MAG: M48 family metalloprotease [Thermoplasmata archaeon]|nr:MAG: M48 family metalloprotease [Thermoplasmata archaeon]